MVAIAARTAADNARYRNLSPVASLVKPTGERRASILPEAELLTEAIIRRGDSPETRRAYAGDLETFARWLAIEGFDWRVVSADDLDSYREWLSEQFARTTCNRRLTVVRALYGEAVRRRLLPDDPAARLRGLRGRDERDGGALTRRQAKEVLEGIRGDLQAPSRALLAIRDLAIVSILIRTGIRRSELASLSVASLGTKQGYPVLTIVGKGNVARTVKLPVDVRRQIDDWILASTKAGRQVEVEDPLFVEVRRGGKAQGWRQLSDRSIYDVVARRVRAAGLDHLGPHGLRASFVTLALEGGAALHLVQRAAGHADPRTTERYWRRKDALDENAVDFIHL
jgi:site-specific recombinase XerD